MIIAEYCGETVEVLDVWMSAGRKVARIRINDGRTPWMEYSHGGPVYTNITTVPVGLLRNVRAVQDECTCRPDRDQSCPACVEYARRNSGDGFPF